MTANSRFLGKIRLSCPFFGETVLPIGQLPARPDRQFSGDWNRTRWNWAIERTD
jgi:hypothetical protein